MNIMITINTDNAAFQPNPDQEVSRILSIASEKIAKNGLGDIGLFDINGNRVGEIRIDN